MKYIKKLNEFNISDIGKNKSFGFDFSPRRGTLNILHNNELYSFYWHEAYSEIIDYLESNTIINNPMKLLGNIIDYVNSITSDITKSNQIMTNKKQIIKSNLSYEDLLIINSIYSLSTNFWLNWDTDYAKYTIKFINDNFKNKLPSLSNILFLDKMIFYYNGYKLDLNTKKWTPSKDIDVSNKISAKNIINIFMTYNFQKQYLKNNSFLINNIPDEILDDNIRIEYDYILKSNNFNI